MTDIVIFNIPPVEHRAPAIGPALIKASLEEKGLSCYVADMNVDIVNTCDLYDTDNHMAAQLNRLRDVDLGDPEVSPEWQTYYDRDIKEWMVAYLKRHLEEHNPPFIGLSLHYYQCATWTIQICRELKTNLNYTGKIVIGGAWVKLFNPVTDKLLETGLVDEVIAGEGENILYEYMTENKTIDHTIYYRVDDYIDKPQADYSDCVIEDYQQPPLFYIEGSRGCVRKCTFCDIPQVKGNFRMKPGAQVAQEMIDLKERYGTRNFRFSDSLLNGSMTQMRELLQTLTEYNDPRPVPQKIKFNSYLIVRGQKAMPESDFDLIKSAGGVMMAVGVESGSESVRWDMKKKITNEDLEYTMNQLIRLKFKIQVQLMIGYPTETEHDFRETLKFHDKYAHLARLRYEPRTGISYPAIELAVNHASRLQPASNELAIEHEKWNLNVDWTSLKWTSEHVTPRISLERYKRIRKVCKDHGYRMVHKRDIKMLETEVERWEQGIASRDFTDGAGF